MQEDPRGVLITTANAEVALQFDATVISFLGQRPETGALLAATLQNDPDLVAGHCMAGLCQMLAATRPLAVQAGRSLALARAAFTQRGGTRREATLLAALAAWHDDDDMWKAAALLDDAARNDPRDILALRLSHALLFMLGDAVGMRLSLEAVMHAWSADVPGYPYVLGCYAFALGETGDLDAAERTGRDGVAMEPHDLWGAHAVAHALSGGKRSRECIAWMSWLDPFMKCGGSFVRHIHWHRALNHLALGEPELAMYLYDCRIRQERCEEVRDVLNAASLLWRLQAAGLPVRKWLWDELADVAESRIGDHAWAFADLHYVLCLAGAGRDDKVAAMLSSIHARSLGHEGTQARVHADVGLATARGVAGAVRGDCAEAATLLAAARPLAHQFGGSHVQRDLLRQMQRWAERDCGRGNDRSRVH